MLEYPLEEVNEDYDDGTMQANVDELAAHVVGHKIVSAEERNDIDSGRKYWNRGTGVVLTLDDGTQVAVVDTSDCCAYTEVEKFLVNPELVDHIIMGVGTTDDFSTWHIYADLGDVLKLDVGWSSGNPFYYGYGFDIGVMPIIVTENDI